MNERPDPREGLRGRGGFGVRDLGVQGGRFRDGGGDPRGLLIAWNEGKATLGGERPCGVFHGGGGNSCVYDSPARHVIVTGGSGHGRVSDVSRQPQMWAHGGQVKVGS